MVRIYEQVQVSESPSVPSPTMSPTSMDFSNDKEMEDEAEDFTDEEDRDTEVEDEGGEQENQTKKRSSEETQVTSNHFIFLDFFNLGQGRKERRRRICRRKKKQPISI